ncbi:hypothetical protein [Algimonas porphyrae]|uniref:DUF2975 domain-containing protein n=2 Tax=Algimonas porphyrae TaxID=1128113 RepID=A0ABQ5UX95_9PROT|nr:hypothetical protein GCM10007854_07860 [Algimonas porphyrae]
MLKWYADVFRFKPDTLTRRKLMRLRALALLALPVFPLFILLRTNLESDVPAMEPLINALDNPAGWGVMFLSFCALTALCLARVINRFWARDRYLDEWEVEMKHASMAFALQCILYLSLFTLIAGMLLQYWGWVDPIRMSVVTAMFILVSLMFYAQFLYVLLNLQPIHEEDELASSA